MVVFDYVLSDASLSILEVNVLDFMTIMKNNNNDIYSKNNSLVALYTRPDLLMHRLTKNYQLSFNNPG